MPFTLQQQALIDAVANPNGGNVLGMARAGAGKTSTALAAIRQMKGTVAVSSFNKEITEEIAGKIAKAGLPAEAKTAHAFGFRAWRKVHPNVKVDKTKFTKVADALELPNHLRGFVGKVVSMAKQRAFGCDGGTNAKDLANWQWMVDAYTLDSCLTDDVLNEAGDTRPREQIILEGLRLAYKALVQSIKMAHEIIDYDDMIFMPLYANARIWAYDWVVVDEAQDTNPARRLLFKRMMKRNGRLLAIGDDKQAIYLFSGADNDALDIMRREFACTVYPLTCTFRCPQAVVREAQQYVPDIVAAPGAAEGRVLRMHENDFVASDLIPGRDAVICRNTKPLVDLFYRFIKSGIPAYVEGKEIGEELTRLAFRWKRVRTMNALVEKLEDFRDVEVERLNALKKGAQAEALADKIEALLAVISGLAPDASMDDLKNRLESMFVDSRGQRVEGVALMTAHRSKGREFARVFVWGANLLMPNRRAETPDQIAQEQNLLYVTITRAMETLVWVDIDPKEAKGKSERSGVLSVTFAEGHAIAA